MKKNYFKKLMCLGIVCIILFNTTAPYPVYAKNPKHNQVCINSVKQLKKAIKKASSDGNISKSEKNYIRNNLNPDTAAEYLDSIQDNIVHVINNTSGTIVRHDYDKKSDSSIQVTKYNVNDAVTVTATIIDEPDTGTFLGKSPLSWGGTSKKLGNRKTTGVYTESIFGWAYTKLSLTLGYKVSSKVITARYSSTSNSSSIGSLSCSSTITDSKASKVGHDMNCVGDYTISALGYATTTLSLELRVKWDHNINSKTKYITYKLYKI